MLIATSPDWLQPYCFTAFAPAAWAKFRAGDHVAVRRGFYWHHAIYVGNGILIEFGSSIFGGIVARVNWEDFAKDGTVELVQHGG